MARTIPKNLKSLSYCYRSHDRRSKYCYEPACKLLPLDCLCDVNWTSEGNFDFVLTNRFYFASRYVLRGGHWEELSSEDLVPGDVVSLKAQVLKKASKSITTIHHLCIFFADNSLMIYAISFNDLLITWRLCDRLLFSIRSERLNKQ